MDTAEHLLTIGEAARRAGVATSTLRYYERRGLVAADERRSGQRRYRPATLRRLVFIGMLQDAGLSLDDIAGILDAPDVDAWKAIASRRLAVLDAEIERLRGARAYWAGRCCAATTTPPPTAASWAPRSTVASTPARRPTRRSPDRSR
ncbi:MAG TPA: MerR family transcriptional regulator [Acidimicrobiales bacterium]